MPTPARRPLRIRVLVVLADLVIAVSLFAATAEVAVRWFKPYPRTQVIRDAAAYGPTGFVLSQAGDEVLWKETGSAARVPPCAPGATVVELFGSSITFGIQLEARDTVGPHLQRLLREGGGSWCVRNEAQPGYVSGQKRATAELVLPKSHPRVVVWEVWSNDSGRYVRIGSSVYNVAPYVVDAEDVPWLPMPSALHHALFRRSLAWEYLTLAVAPTDPDWEIEAWRTRTVPDLARVHALAEAQHARMLVVLMAHLNRPFSTSLTKDAPDHPYALAVAEAGRLGVPVVEVSEAWKDRDPRSVALDDVHLNAAGHTLLAELLAPRVRELAERE